MGDNLEALKNITDCHTRQTGENPPCVSCDLGYEEEDCTCLDWEEPAWIETVFLRGN